MKTCKAATKKLHFLFMSQVQQFKKIVPGNINNKPKNFEYDENPTQPYHQGVETGIAD